MTSQRSVRRLFVIIPALDEERTVGDVVASLLGLEITLEIEVEKETEIDEGVEAEEGQEAIKIEEVIVVDNGSRDATALVAHDHGAIVLREPEHGYGAACLRGLSYLNHEYALPPQSQDIVIFIDADGCDRPEDLPQIVQPILKGEADFVVGSRLQTARARAAVSPVARLGNRFATWLIERLYGVAFSDLGPFRAIRYEALTRLQMQDRTWGWTVEMQLKACEQGLTCREVAVAYRRRQQGRSKISGTFSGVIRAASKILWVLGQHLLQRWLASKDQQRR